MKHHTGRIDDVLRRSMPSAPAQEMEAALQRVAERVWPNASSSQSEVPEILLDLKPRRNLNWTWVPAIVATVLVVAIWIGMTSQQREIYGIVETGDASLVAGSRIELDQPVRTGDTGAGFRLVDGSQVEVRAASEFKLERAEDGVRIHLLHGGLIVSAAKQRDGHLYVVTKDVTVSVVGTVFLINAEEEGSRVAVIEGELRVQDGSVEKRLQSGEQITTRQLEWLPVSKEISWSRSKETHLALLQQSTAAPSAGAEPRQAFEVVSVRPTANSNAAGERGGGGGRRRNPRPTDEPCGSEFNEPVIDPGRFDASNTTAAALFFWAYGLDCVLGRGSDRLFGGPDWFKNDGFDVLAVIPKGTPLYTREQLWAHDAPQLQGMLQTMLAERFQLSVHSETKEMPVYVLTAARGGPRLIASSTATRPAPVTQPGGRVVFAAGSSEPEPNGMSVWREGNDTCCQSVGPGLISGKKKSMAWLAKWVGWAAGRLVVDRTGLAGEFNFQFTFEPDRPMPPGFPVDTRSIFKALEEDFGLKLEAKTEKIEVLVIDRVLRPSEN